MAGAPYPKSSQLARGERRYRRKVASPKQWQAIRAAKGAACRLGNLECYGHATYHHIVPRRSPYFGDDVADNIVPLCHLHHTHIEGARIYYHELLAKSLTDAEYAYVVGKLGESGMERLFGVGQT